MIIPYLVIGSMAMWQSGAFYTAYKINKMEDKPYKKLLWWSFGLCVLSLYFLISMIGSIK